MRRRRLLVVVAVVGCALAAAAVPVWRWVNRRPGLEQARAGAPPFQQLRPTWATDSTVHDGDRSFDIGPGVVTAVTPAAYGSS